MILDNGKWPMLMVVMKKKKKTILNYKNDLYSLLYIVRVYNSNSTIIRIRNKNKKEFFEEIKKLF